MTGPKINTGFDNAVLQHHLHQFFDLLTMVATSAILSLFYGFIIVSINIVFDKGGTGNISNTRSALEVSAWYISWSDSWTFSMAPT